MSQRRKPRRASFVVTVAAVAASAVACGGSVGSDSGSGGSGGSGGTGGGGYGGSGGNPPPPPVKCPASMPQYGDECASPGLACEYPGYQDECGQQIDYLATCTPELTWTTGTTGGGTSCNPPPPWNACPAEEPVVGEGCWVDPNDVCSYPTECCADVYQCVNYVWQETGLECNPPALICPETLPTDGQACDPCSYASCTYGSCGSTSWVATCSGGIWSVLTNPC